MPPRQFYEIEPVNYLFGKSDRPEEKVRQWTIFELLSTYGFNINSLQIEVQCKIGSKYFPADIVVYQDHIPLIVFECKRQDNQNQEESIKQAISYANYLKAEFVVFTNGNLWVVKRRIKDNWYPVSDIEKKADKPDNKSITALLWFLSNARPLLFWAYRSVPIKHAKKFMTLLQVFVSMEFHSRFLDDVDKNLLGTTQSLAELACSGREDLSFGVGEFEIKKIKIAAFYFENYSKSFNDEVGFGNKDFYDYQALLNTLASYLADLVNRQKDLCGNNKSLARLTLSIAQYMQRVLENNRYQDIPASLLVELQNFIDGIIISKLGMSIPDILDDGDFQEFKILCSDKWNRETDH